LCAYKDSGNLTLLLRPIGDDTKVDGGKGDLPKIVPPGDQIVEKPRVRHDEGFVQYISNGQSTKQTRFIKRDKKWMNDSERSGDTGPSGSGEGN
jgi:hypothetical protein